MSKEAIPEDIQAAIDRHGVAAVVGWATLAVHAPAPSAATPWVDQRASPLGPRQHCALARRLIEAGDARASKAGRRWLVRSDALELELGRMGRGKITPAVSGEQQLAHLMGFEVSA